MTNLNAMIKYYETNKDFKRYVDECVKTYGKDVNHMLQQGITEQYYLYLKENDKSKPIENI